MAEEPSEDIEPQDGVMKNPTDASEIIPKHCVVVTMAVCFRSVKHL